MCQRSPPLSISAMMRPARSIGTATRRKSDDQAHRPRWIRLRLRELWHGRQRGSTRCQLQKLSAGKFHGVASLVFAMSRAQSSAGTRCEQTAKLNV
jgi:hypothetical protein